MPDLIPTTDPKVGRGLKESVIDPVSLQEMAIYAAMTPKQRLDIEKIRRCGHDHPYGYDEWVVWTGNNYIKSWYDVQLNDDVILMHMWPNAGKLSGKGLQFSAEDNVKVRLSMNSPF